MKTIIEVITFVDFVRKKKIVDKVRDHCHLTDNHRGPAHSKNNINIAQKQSNFIPFVFPFFTMIFIYFVRSQLVKRFIK